MSASREKQTRQTSQTENPRTAREAQQRKEEKRSSVLYKAVAVVFLLVVLASVVWRTNLIPKMSTAATIDGQKYSAAEVSYYYNNAYQNFVNQYSYFVSYLGLDTNTPLKNQFVSETAASMLGIELPGGEETESEDAAAPAEGEDADAPAEGENADAPAEGENADAPAETNSGMTWHDYFVDQALENMSVIQKTLEKAKSENFAYPDSVQAQQNASMDALKATAAASNVSVSQYLGGVFGAGMTEKVYSEQLLRVLQYSAYVDAYNDSLSYSDDELESVYAADPNSFDHVSYEYASFSGAAETTTDEEGNTVEPTEEESAAALEAARSSANALMDELASGGSLEDVSKNYEDASYAVNDNATYYAGSAVSEWLYDASRNEGDTSVVEDGTTVYVLEFHNRFREEYNTIDIRHILVPLGTATLTEEDEGYAEEQEQLKADAKAKAEEMHSQWQSGEATEESFAALAMAESSDGSRYDGGLYSEVYQGQMVAEFNDWCFDASRKPGDTGVVETQYGAHVMYFSGTNLPRWAAQAASQLRNEDYAEWEESLTEGVSVAPNDSGMKFVG